MCFCCVFFFQAEDGIRDLVRSRGLGDVYKRQVLAATAPLGVNGVAPEGAGLINYSPQMTGNVPYPVSYTHLTLPTSDLV